MTHKAYKKNQILNLMRIETCLMVEPLPQDELRKLAQAVVPQSTQEELKLHLFSFSSSSSPSAEAGEHEDM